MSEEILKRLEKIENDISRVIDYISRQNSTIQPPPYIPDNLKLYQTNCAKCGLSFEGCNSYYCSDPDCPTFMKTTL